MSKSFYWVLIANSTTIWPGFRASSIYFYIHTILQLCDIHPPPPQQHFFYKHSKVKFLSIFLINMILGCQKVTNIDPDVFYQNFLQMTNPVVQHLPVQNIFLLWSFLSVHSVYFLARIPVSFRFFLHLSRLQADILYFSALVVLRLSKNKLKEPRSREQKKIDLDPIVNQ